MNKQLVELFAEQKRHWKKRSSWEFSWILKERLTTPPLGLQELLKNVGFNTVCASEQTTSSKAEITTSLENDSVRITTAAGYPQKGVLSSLL